MGRWHRADQPRIQLAFQRCSGELLLQCIDKLCKRSCKKFPYAIFDAKAWNRLQLFYELLAVISHFFSPI
jgi:hypothetical protein